MNVSIIIPVYLVSDHIEQCVCSVIDQSYTDIECIIVDDATKDDSIEKCRKIINDYHGPIRFHVVHHETNRGLSAARNTGIQAAKGDYLYFLDGDDELTTDCIKTLAAIAAKAPDVDMIIGNYKCVPRNKNHNIILDKKTPLSLDSNENVATAFLNHRIPMNAWNKLLKRSFVLEHNLFFKEGIVFEDVHWTFFVAKYLNNMRICQGITYRYNIRQSSIVNSTEPIVVGNSFHAIYEDILQQLTKGREAKELNCYVEGFCNCYLQYRTIIPEYENLYKVYSSKAQDFGCKEVLLKLRLAYMMGKVPFGLGILGMMKSAKTGVTKIKREFN
jgi:glycosyltransferase involved in cell wall biosynthesis